VIISIIAAILALLNVSQFAQTQSQLPRPTQHISDFAQVLEAGTRDRLETVLQNLKAKSKVDFYVAVVEGTGSQDLADYAGELASQWKLGAITSTNKSLLLVISVATKSSFTRFSRLVQRDLPDGVLGDMAQRMRSPLGAGDFSLALDDGVRFFVNAMARKIGFNADDLDKPIVATTAVETASPATVPIEVSAAQTTRPRSVFEPAPTPPETRLTESKPPENVSTTTESKPKPTRTPTPKNTAASKKVTTQVSDEDESEEVELTLTLPLAKRAIKLKEFLDTHPNSKSRARAVELLISTHAALGDQLLKSGDQTGVEQLLLAISEADTEISDQLFAGVISQIPMNLYLRREQTAAFKAAEEIEKKFSNNAKRLLAVAGFYLGIERGDEAVRVADLAMQLSPDSADAHRIKGMGLHLSLRLDDAMNEYKRALELDPNSKSARGSLADLLRSAGKAEEALALYNEELKLNPKDGPARTGAILSLLDLGRRDEALTALEAAEADDPKSLSLLTGVAYWFAAHDNFEKAFEYAKKAVSVEPRYTWAQIAMTRSLLGMKRPLDAERAMRYARQFGKFPTLDYELANVLASMGLYDEAVEVLRQSFGVVEGQLETRLAGRFPAKGESFPDLLAPERRASIYQASPAEAGTSSKVLKDLLVFTGLIAAPADGQKPDETLAATAAREFASGSDNMRTFRQLYAASRLIRTGIAFATAYDLAEEAKKNSAGSLEIPLPTLAVQADEYRDLRSRAISGGNVPDVADAPREALSKILIGRSEDLMGWALFSQEKHSEALEHLKRAAELLPTGTPSWRSATWHLAIAQEQAGNNSEALDNYIRSYKAGDPDPVRRVAIEQLYRKMNGSLDGLDEKMGQAVAVNATVSSEPMPPTAEASKPAATPETTSAASEIVSSHANPDKSPQPEAAKPSESPSPTSEEVKPSSTPETSPSAAPSSNAEPAPTPSAVQATTRATNPGDSDEAMKAAATRLRSIVKISGRILDSNNSGIGNVVVVLISPSGSVIASTTNTDGEYSFTVAASEKTYRLIPSKDGYTFTPIDRTFSGLYDNQRAVDFTGVPARPQ